MDNIAKWIGGVYSQEEQVVGKWIDNKPLYQKTWLGLSVSLSDKNWSNVVDVSSLSIDTLVDNFGIYNSQKRCFVSDAKINNNYVQLISSAPEINVLTIQYTKTID